jgi:hypothetical protein
MSTLLSISCYKATLAIDPRTSNEFEAWNCVFSQQIGHSHPSLFELIDNLQNDNTLVLAAIASNSCGQPHKRE